MTAGRNRRYEKEKGMEKLLLAFAVSFVLTLVIGRFVLRELRKLKAG